MQNDIVVAFCKLNAADLLFLNSLGSNNVTIASDNGWQREVRESRFLAEHYSILFFYCWFMVMISYARVSLR